MIKYLRDEKYQLFWFVFHALLGFSCIYTKVVLIGWFYLICINMVITVFSKTDVQLNLVCFMGYMLGFEVLARGIYASPFIPHEMGKYFGVFGFTAGLVLGGPIKKLSLYGIAMVLLSFPSLLVIPNFNHKDIVFNYLGPLALFFGVIFCKRQVITYSQFKQLSRIVVYGIFSLACYCIFRASTFEKVQYGLTANFESAGGTITNQVATLLGAGIALLTLMILVGQQLFRYKWMDYVILGLFLVRGLLTFSRGGLIGALLAIIAVIIFPKAKASWQDSEVKLKSISPVYVLIITFGLTISFLAVNSITDNYLLYRYQGKTERSLRTGFDNDIDLQQLSSGRYTIMQSDFNMFFANPALGVGVGQSKYVRPFYGEGERNSASHLEFSRLLAEHGILGLILVILIYIYPVFIILNEPNNYRRSIRIIFFVIAITATFHSAMRTMITPLFFAFSFLNIVPDSYDWRSHLKKKHGALLINQNNIPALAEAKEAVV